MAIKTILVPVNGTDRSRAAMETAFTVGRDLGAHVTVLHVSADARDALPLMGEGMAGSMIEDMLEMAGKEIAERRQRAKDMFDTFCSRYKVPVIDAPPAPEEVSAAFVNETGPEDMVVARRGRLADLLVGRSPDRDGGASARLVLNACLFDTGRPVLVAPETAPTAVGRNVAVAWNGSAQSARAVHSAMPFLEAAKTIHVLTVETDETDASAAGELAAFLSWHGVEAVTETVPEGADAGVGRAILERCGELGVDLMVMGAYTHSRMRELILGGVTRDVLTDAPIAVLMAH